jgi:hypothetical protein
MHSPLPGVRQLLLEGILDRGHYIRTVGEMVRRPSRRHFVTDADKTHACSISVVFAELIAVSLTYIGHGLMRT